MKRVMVWMLLAIVGLSVVCLAGDVVTFQKIVDASNALQTFSAAIMMTQHSGKKASTIEFQFTYVPPAKMRIEYTAPKTLVGQLVIINGDQVYTYMPALHRSMHKTVSADSGHQGEEMGFLYYFVDRRVGDFARDYKPSPVEGPQTYSFEHDGSTFSYDAYKVTLTGKKGRQIVWCDAHTFVPIAIDIYDGEKLAIEVRVLNYKYNGSVPEATFTIPDRQVEREGK